MVNEAFFRDANRVPITTDGLVTAVLKSLTASNQTLAVPLFSVTGSVECRGLWGVVTTALGSNVTAAYFRLNDQTAQSDITLNTGTTLSSYVAGATLIKRGKATSAIVGLNATQERVDEPTNAESIYFSPFTIVKKPEAETDIEFVYTTNQTPTTGAIQFFLRWLPLSADAAITTL